MGIQLCQQLRPYRQLCRQVLCRMRITAKEQPKATSEKPGFLSGITLPAKLFEIPCQSTDYAARLRTTTVQQLDHPESFEMSKHSFTNSASGKIDSGWHRSKPETWSSRGESSYEKAAPYEERPKFNDRRKSLGLRFDEQALELRTLRDSYEKLREELADEREQRLDMEQSHEELKAETVQLRNTGDNLQEQLAVTEALVQKLTDTNTSLEETLDTTRLEMEELRKGHQDEKKGLYKWCQAQLRKKTARIEELYSEDAELKKKLFDLNLQSEYEELSLEDILSEEPPPFADHLDKNKLQEQLEASIRKTKSLEWKLKQANEDIELYKPVIKAQYFIRHRFLTSKDENQSQKTRNEGNRSAHDGNIVVDLVLFIKRYFIPSTHGEAFQARYGRNIKMFLDQKLDLSVLKRMPTVCAIWNFRATMYESKSFTEQSLDPQTDEEFLILFNEFQDNWFKGRQRNDPVTLASLEENAEVVQLHDQMKEKMKRIVSLSTERRRSHGPFEQIIKQDSVPEKIDCLEEEWDL
ncbi:hypothetical protein HYFRA_00002756 [Hymenoscyphus fraxineus]|uniref:Uncharacterized protein n=1 Tax=Hymenoscyphus fraxineus TaxID=746836 RepID=A0A9N9KPT3_9HELO|nr:hypothetical protein HYFRA_00002756 [Hymenoscyphus fraxineus]